MILVEIGIEKIELWRTYLNWSLDLDMWSIAIAGNLFAGKTPQSVALKRYT